MPKYSDFLGAIFDVDDTLLDNLNSHESGNLHVRSRLAATREIGRQRGIKELNNLSLEKAHQAWLDSKVHSLEGAVWQTMYSMGVVNEPEIDHSHPILKEITKLKDELHEDILHEFGQELPGAGVFVKSLAAHGFKGKLALASTANRHDIDVSIEKIGLSDLFPAKNRISKADVTHLKPHPELFDKAFESLGLPDGARSQVLAFEDDPRGVASAKAAGLYVCAITSCFDGDYLAKQAVAPDLIADNYYEFAELLGLPL